MITPEQLATGSETAEQTALFAWCALNRAQYPALKWLFHVNNGDRSPSKAGIIRGGRAKAMGVKRGVPDICLPVGRWHHNHGVPEWSAQSRVLYHAGLFIELKVKTGIVSDEQKEWLNHLNESGYCAKVCWSWQEARDLLIWYLS